MYETWNKTVKPQLTCCDTNSQLWGLKPCDLDFEHGNPNILNGGQVCLLMTHQHARFGCKGFRAQKAHGSQSFSEVFNPVTLTLLIAPQTSYVSLHGNNTTARQVWGKFNASVGIENVSLHLGFEKSNRQFWMMLPGLSLGSKRFNGSDNMGQLKPVNSFLEELNLHCNLGTEYLKVAIQSSLFLLDTGSYGDALSYLVWLEKLNIVTLSLSHTHTNTVIPIMLSNPPPQVCYRPASSVSWNPAVSIKFMLCVCFGFCHFKKVLF